MMKKESKVSIWTLAETMSQLKALGIESRRKHNTKNGASENQFGVKLGDMRKIAFPMSKGCTSPFAPIWINEIVSRQK